MKTAPTLPFFIRLSDYHAFDEIQAAMRLLNPKVRVEEVELEKFYVRNGRLLPYTAIVFEGRSPKESEILEMLNNKRTKIHIL